jgi:hypothetical protein
MLQSYFREMGPKKRRRSKKKNENDTNTATDVCNQLVEDIDRKQLVEDIDRKKHNKQEEYGVIVNNICRKLIMALLHRLHSKPCFINHSKIYATKLY